jgi:hypothetical protein
LVFLGWGIRRDRIRVCLRKINERI